MISENEPAADNERPAYKTPFVMPTLPEGACELCHSVHKPTGPHNLGKRVYGELFYAAHGRWPTWTDAMGHCTAEVKDWWRKFLIRNNTENGMPIPPDLQTEGTR